MNETIMLGLSESTDQLFLRQSAIYFEEMKNSESGWKLCIEAVTSKRYSSRDHAQFFCLQVIDAYVKKRYSSDTSENQQRLRDFIRVWPTIQEPTDSLVIRSKIAQITARLFMRDYSHRCNEFFDDLVASLGHGDRNQTVDFFLRLLIEVDSKIGDREICRSAAKIQRNNSVKDAMREKVIVKLVSMWLEILTAFENTSNDIIGLCHQVIGAYILWIDIDLIANEHFVSHLVKALNSPIIQESAADCIYGIISKGMEPLSKVKLVESFSTFLSSAGIWNAAFSSDTDPDYLAKLGRIVNGMGVELITAYNKVFKAAGSKSTETTHQIRQAIEAKFILLLQLLSNEDDDISASVFDFLRDYLHLLKGKTVYSEMEMTHLADIVKVISAKIRYDCDYNFEHEGEDEISFKEFRKQLRVIFDNLILVDKSLVLDQLQIIILEVFRNWRQLPFQDVEAALYLLHLMGESLPSVVSQISPDPEKYSTVQRLLLEMTASEVNLHMHSAVTIQYFEVAVRYDKFYLQHTECTGQVLTTFLKTSGLFHPDRRVRSRSAYLLSRFIKSIRSQITSDLTRTLLESVVPLIVLSPDATLPEAQLSYDDQLYVYEVVGVVILAGESGQEQRFNYMRQVLSPLIEYYRNTMLILKGAVDPVSKRAACRALAQVISIVGRITKAFSPHDTMKSCGCSAMYLEALGTFVEAIDIADGVLRMELTNAIRQYFHRLVVCLDSEILPVVPLVSQVLLRDTSAKSIQEYFPLITQIISKFRCSWLFQKDVTPYLTEIFPMLVQNIMAELALPIEENNESAKSDREFLRRQYFQFLACVFSNALTEIFPSNSDLPFMSSLFSSIAEGSLDYADPVAQKTCFTILKRCIDGNCNSTFRNFMYTHIVPSCFHVPGHPSIDMNDAQSILLVNETAACMKAIYVQNGDELIEVLRTKFLLPPRFSAETSDAYIAALRGDLKHFKVFIKTLFTKRN